MTAASIQHRPSSRKRKPAPATVLQLYRHEVSTSGLRGAANRTAAALGISDDTVRRIVTRDEEARKAREETPPELEYVPFDPDYEAERIAANAAVAPILTELLAADIAAKQENSERQLMSSPELEMRPNTDEAPQINTAECRILELKNDTPQTAQMPQSLPEQHELEDEPMAPAAMPQPVIIRERVIVREVQQVGLVGWVREHPGAAHQAVAWLIAAVLIGVASLG